MKHIILILVLVSILVGLVAACNVDDAASSQSCYVIGFTEVKAGDTWQKIANHFEMSVSTLKAMNRNVKFVLGAQLKVPMWVGCPR